MKENLNVARTIIAHINTATRKVPTPVYILLVIWSSDCDVTVKSNENICTIYRRKDKLNYKP
jgi:hypothetical protein